MEQFKTKVIAFRVNAEEYEALTSMAALSGEKTGVFVYRQMAPVTAVALSNLRLARKKAEAKAKRQAKKEAQNGVQS